MKEHAVMHSDPSIPCQFCGYMFKEKRSLVRHTSKEANCNKCQNTFNCIGLFKKHKCYTGTQVQNQSENKQTSDNEKAGDIQTLKPLNISNAEMLLDYSDNNKVTDDSIEIVEMDYGNLDKAQEKAPEHSPEATKEDERRRDTNIFAHNQMLRYFQEIDDILAHMNTIINA